jgi:hypothetical protein
MAAVPAVLLSLWVAVASPSGAATVAVESDSSCPAPDDVARRLGPLLPAASARGYRLLVSTMSDTVPPQLRLVLADARGVVVVDRAWPLRGDCGLVAQEIAVLVAAWVGDLPPSPEGDLGLTAPDVTVDPPAVTPGAPAAPPAALVTEPPARAPERPSGRLTPAIFVGAGMTSPFALWVSPALSLGGLLYRAGEDSAYGGIGFSGNVPRTYGDQYWYQVRVGAEAGYRWRWGRHGAALGAGVGGGVLRIAIRDQMDGINRDFTYGDFSLFGQARWMERLGSEPSSMDGWVALRFTDALKFDASRGGGNGTAPQSPYEFSLTAGVDFPLGD